jgi:hypothetical protein
MAQAGAGGKARRAVVARFLVRCATLIETIRMMTVDG